MPPQRSKLRRTTTLTGSSSFYDKSGAIGDTTAVASSSVTSLRDTEMTDAALAPRSRGEGGGNDTDDDECCLTGYGELSSDAMFMLPPSPTQTIQYRYPAYRAKLAKMNKKRRAAAGGTGKTKSSASYHNGRSDYASLLGPSFEGLTGISPKREFQALLHKYRDSAEGWRDTELHTPSRKTTTPAGASAGKSTSSALRREGSRLGRNAF